MSQEIAVHPLTNDPTTAWSQISKNQKLIKIKVKLPSKPVEPNKVRFVCMSDTHSLIRNITFDIPDGDVFIHSGDFTKCGQRDEVIQFNKWLEKLPHKHKIVIAGNHELSFDNEFSDIFKIKMEKHTKNDVPNYGNTKDNIGEAVNTPYIRQYLTNCTYLEDSGVDVYGIHLYGSPWSVYKQNLFPNLIKGLLLGNPSSGNGRSIFRGAKSACRNGISSRKTLIFSSLTHLR